MSSATGNVGSSPYLEKVLEMLFENFVNQSIEFSTLINYAFKRAQFYIESQGRELKDLQFRMSSDVQMYCEFTRQRLRDQRRDVLRRSSESENLYSFTEKIQMEMYCRLLEVLSDPTKIKEKYSQVIGACSQKQL